MPSYLDSVFLFINWTRCIDGFSLLLQRYVKKGNDAENPDIISSFSFAEGALLLVSTKDRDLWEGLIFGTCAENSF